MARLRIATVLCFSNSDGNSIRRIKSFSSATFGIFFSVLISVTSSGVTGYGWSIRMRNLRKARSDESILFFEKLDREVTPRFLFAVDLSMDAKYALYDSNDLFVT